MIINVMVDAGRYRLSTEVQIIGTHLSDDYSSSNKAERLFAADGIVRIIRLFRIEWSVVRIAWLSE